MTQIKRYGLMGQPSYNKEHAFGEWVLFSDHEKAMLEAKQKLKEWAEDMGLAKELILEKIDEVFKTK